jgi:hypothetical protein
MEAGRVPVVVISLRFSEQLSKKGYSAISSSSSSSSSSVATASNATSIKNVSSLPVGTPRPQLRVPTSAYSVTPSTPNREGSTLR